MAKKPSGFDFRDVSVGLQKLRAILLGREPKKHNRFPPLLSPRTIPAPDIPRGPEHKYSKQYYFQRSVPSSVKPPVVAPIAEGPPIDYDRRFKPEPGGLKPDMLRFQTPPTPGLAWWWDGHSCWETTPDHKGKKSASAIPAPSNWNPVCPPRKPKKCP